MVLLVWGGRYTLSFIPSLLRNSSIGSLERTCFVVLDFEIWRLVFLLWWELSFCLPSLLRIPCYRRYWHAAKCLVFWLWSCKDGGHRCNSSTCILYHRDADIAIKLKFCWVAAEFMKESSQKNRLEVTITDYFQVWELSAVRVWRGTQIWSMRVENWRGWIGSTRFSVFWSSWTLFYWSLQLLLVLSCSFETINLTNTSKQKSILLRQNNSSDKGCRL